MPEGTGSLSEYLAVSGLGVTLWRRDGSELYTLAAKLISPSGSLRRGSVPPGTTGPLHNRYFATFMPKESACPNHIL